MWITTKEAGKLFPVPISSRSVTDKIRRGNDGIRLKAQFDGKRFVLRPEWITEFLDALTARKLRGPVRFTDNAAEAMQMLREMKHVPRR